MATSAVFAELKQFKAICPGNRQTHTHTLTDYRNLRYVPMYSEVNYGQNLVVAPETNAYAVNTTCNDVYLWSSLKILNYLFPLQS